MGIKQSALSINLIKSDPLSNILINKLKMTPGRILVVMFTVACLWRLVVPLSSLVFLQPPMKFPPSVDAIVLSFVETPFFWAYFLWSKEQLGSLFSSILNNKLLKSAADQARYRKFVGETSSVFGMKKIYVLTIVIALLLTEIQIFYFFRGNPDIWYEPYTHPSYALGEMLLYTFSQYIVVTVMVTEIIVIGRLKKLFDEYEIKVHFDFPHRSGGWGEIGRHALGVSFYLVVFGLWLTGLTLGADARFVFSPPIKMFFWILFSLLAPIGFIAPLVSAHWAMQGYKTGILKEISEHINSLFDNSKKLIGSPDFNRKGVMRLVSELRDWYVYLDKTIPVWPFPTAIFPKIVGTWLLPLISGLLTTYAQNYIKKAFP